MIGKKKLINHSSFGLGSFIKGGKENSVFFTFLQSVDFTYIYIRFFIDSKKFFFSKIL